MKSLTKAPFGAAALLFCIILTPLSCQRKAEATFPPLTVSGANADALWKRIKVDSPYAGYAYWPGHDGVREGQSPHGPFHRIFINAVFLAALPSPSLSAPEGAIIVKENMDADRKLTNLTVMAKIRGFDPENGDWFWARFDLEGKASASGKVGGCIACHAGMKDNDYVIVRKLDAP
ncbi:MAG: hypothetical protein A2413_08350 [Treponema sp. RIFOXYC1_FULL_61_9]|nr:MAG: hypothetical protein A2001_03550 [Treponema sp. GWC1_61_84]OHE75066.1 MAG: hypothetical protein A2413_08350 [Treponema sp. RIFOXYC1_FULL_61_9]